MAQLYDLVIIGAGAAGMSAAIYAGRAKLKTLVLEREQEGGQIKITNEVDNYPGILQTSGATLAATMRQQAQKFGVVFANQTVERVNFERDLKRVYTTEEQYLALAVIIATGAVPRALGFEGEAKFKGRGISYCATCDGEFFTGKEVLVVGGGLAAAEEALFLTRYATKITMLVRKDKLSVPLTIAEKIQAHPQIDLRFNTELKQVGGDQVLRFAKLFNNKTGQTQHYEVVNPSDSFGVFVFAGYEPQTAEFAKVLELDQQGYIITDQGMRTTIAGVYAAGDVRPKELRQLVTAVADGAIAATNAEKEIEVLHERLGLPIFEVANTNRKAADAVCNLEDNATPLLSFPRQRVALGEERSDERNAGNLDINNEEDATPKPNTREAHKLDDSAVFFNAELIEQLSPILDRFETQVGIVAIIDKASSLGAEIQSFLEEFSKLTDKVSIEYLQAGLDSQREQDLKAVILPSIVLTSADGLPLGVQFHGVPVGHELNSFVLALYNAAGPGQSIDEVLAKRIAALDKETHIKVGVSLSCTMCPDVVAATQLIALRNPHVTAEMIDVSSFPDFKNQWNIMSVPAIVINDTRLEFGKRSLDQLLDLL